MNELLNTAELLQVQEGRAMADSLGVARHFDKQHKNMLQSIQNLECSEEFNRLNFQPVSYTDAKGEARPMYLMTRDGFTMLCFGFTGPKAAHWKERYIAAFNSMEAELLKERQQGKLGETERELLDVYRDHLRLLRSHKKRGSKLTHEEKNQIWRLTLAGYNHHYIAQKLGRDAGNIRRWQKLLLEFSRQKLAEYEENNKK